jgi:SNF2 family DNA or RNA helicase
MIIGETSKERRHDIVRNFQQDNLRVLLANIQAAGTGLTLDAGSTIIFLDRAYTNTLNEQAEDRIIATKETSNLDAMIIDLVCENSIDQKIQEILSKKKSITEVINNYRSVKEFINDKTL